MGIRIEDWRSGARHAADFVRLNTEWIERYFKIEDSDRRVFADPGAIVAAGGNIFFAVDGQPGDVVGCCAIVRHGDPASAELAKMAVSPAAQGRGAGRLLGEAAVGYARQSGASRVFLEANTALEASVRLYRRLGFVPADCPRPAYSRCNLFMELRL